ncbi:MAG TPA: dienelactone hydrolase family protein [Candidatus Angelobacter sp.]
MAARVPNCWLPRVPALAGPSLCAPLPIRDLGWKTWPAAVPVQVHFAEKDHLRDQRVIDSLASRVQASGAAFQHYDYPASGHLFADPDMAAYDAPAAELMFQRVLEFLVQGSAH